MPIPHNALATAVSYNAKYTHCDTPNITLMLAGTAKRVILQVQGEYTQVWPLNLNVRFKRQNSCDVSDKLV